MCPAAEIRVCPINLYHCLCLLYAAVDKTGEEGQAEQVEEEVAADDEEKKHEPSCNLFERLNALKEDEELVSLANDFVQHLLRAAQEEALRRGHVQSKVCML